MVEILYIIFRITTQITITLCGKHQNVNLGIILKSRLNASLTESKYEFFSVSNIYQIKSKIMNNFETYISSDYKILEALMLIVSF